ncbi:hypothetical protein [Streptomyces roseicoloratus]|uniref:ABC transporter permease n=1 Tax=Streptomyces roseicoloratus TaxID=2508722 RepID=A0ABY9RZX0_9ACTN|nr:hypothetical protein [Streptomyces roseicoloratus]WMX47724.1 hypothetical protein RGF97_26975 [Streptomyces roseicoloratus]
MTARTHTGAQVRRTGVDTRLPWWALALPVAAFAALFLLVTGSSDAPAAAGDPGVGRFLAHLQQTLSP